MKTAFIPLNSIAVKNMKRIYLAFFLVFLSVSCEEESDNEMNGTAIASFTIESLREIENSDTPLTIYIGLDNFSHAGGTIEVDIAGGSHGSDYMTSENAGNFTLDIESGALVSSFTIQPIDNDVIGQNKQLTITLTSVTGSLELGESNSISYTIIENDEPQVGIIDFESETFEVQENASEATMINLVFDKVTTNGGAITIDGTGEAVLGTDFTIEGATELPFTLVIDGGSNSANFLISPIDNSEFSENKMITFSLTEATGDVKIGTQTETLVTLVNDDAPEIPVIDFANSTATIAEDGGSVTVNFILSGIVTEDANVEFSVNGSSTASLMDDYDIEGQPTSPYILNVTSGSASTSLKINIVDDMDTEEDETIILDISNVSGGLDAGLNLQQQTITIIDNDNTAFDYVETFETVASLDAAGFQAFLLPSQDLPASKLFKYNMNGGKYAGVDDVTQDSDTGLVVFYNITQNGEGTIDNVIVTPQMQVTGDVDVSIDIAYSQAPSVNNGVITFYYSETYNGSETWNDSDWVSIGTETAASMKAEGFATSDYKRKVMSINTSANFYLAVRVNQTMDATFTKTQWRLDNFKVNN